MIGFDPEKQLRILTQALSGGEYDVVALQEVNQLNNGDAIPLQELDSYVPCQDRVPVKKGNFAFQITEALKNSGQIWYWSWLPVHLGYGHYDEGIAIMTPHPIRKTDAFYLSATTDYQNFKTRMALGIQTVFTGNPEWFYSVQFGWWNDPEEPFSAQWDRFEDHTGKLEVPLYVMGDFSAPDDAPGEAYDYIFSHSNLTDTFKIAEVKDSNLTLTGAEEEWKDPKDRRAMRADLILTDSGEPVLNSEVLFQGKRYPRISDHLGLEVTFGEKTTTLKNDPGTRIPQFVSAMSPPAPPAVITSSGPMVVRTRRIRLMNSSDPFQLLRESIREAERSRDILETIIFGDDES